ncbi:MAG: hypothetical protein ACRDRJ_36275 [Streptosporangiaceae bacterium]
MLVEDVEATCRRAEQAGGKVQRPTQRNPLGVTFAYLLDRRATRSGCSRRRPRPAASSGSAG